MTILIIGACGFIGKHLVRAIQQHHHVVALSRIKRESQNDHHVTWITQDLTTPLAVDDLPAKIDAVIHLAQSRHYRDFPDKAPDIYGVNVAGTMNLLEYARQAGASQFIYTSTGGIYDCSPYPITETVTPAPFRPGVPLSFYFTTKYTAELLVQNYQAHFTTTILRPFFVYGPGQQGMLIANLMNRVKNGETITIQGRPGIRMNPIHVGDMVQAIKLLLESRTGGIFNVAGNETLSLSELVQIMGTVTGHQPVIQHTPSDTCSDLVADTTLLRQTSGFLPQISLHDGLRQFV